MSRPLMTPNPKVAPAEPAPSPKVQERRISPPRSAVRELAALGLPLFQKMHKLGVIIPMKIGIRNDVLAVTDPTQHKAVKKLLNVVARSRAYQYALTSDGAMRCDLQGDPVEPVSREHRDIALATISGGRKLSGTGTSSGQSR